MVPLDRYLGIWVGSNSENFGINFIIYGVLIMIILSIEPRGIWSLIKKGKR